MEAAGGLPLCAATVEAAGAPRSWRLPLPAAGAAAGGLLAARRRRPGAVPGAVPGGSGAVAGDLQALDSVGQAGDLMVQDLHLGEKLEDNRVDGRPWVTVHGS